jgi:hypothetical protein
MDFFLEIKGDNVSKIVESTRHLWTLTAAGAAVAPVWKVLCIFARRLSLPRDAEADVQSLLDVATLFQITLKDEAWERLLSEYLRSGLFDTSHTSDKTITEAARSTHMQTLVHLNLTAADLKIIDQPLNIPQVDARPARGRVAAVAYAAAQMAPTELQYIGRCKLPNMFNELKSPLEPALPWCLLAGIMGDYFHRTNREDGGSSVRLGAEMLLHVIRRNSGYATASDDLLAGLVPDTLIDNLLPFDFLDDFKWPHMARLELSDGASYTTGTEAQREAVETRRIHLVGTTR